MLVLFSLINKHTHYDIADRIHTPTLITDVHLKTYTDEVLEIPGEIKVHDQLNVVMRNKIELLVYVYGKWN